MFRNRLAAVAAASVLTLTLAACAESQRETGGEDGDSPEPGDTSTFIFGAAGEPRHFDPFYASDGETFRITRQLYEGLLDFEPGEAIVAPGLATDWSSSDDGLEWTFQIREGVTFHDGTDLTGQSVCDNFERWYNQEGDAQSSAVTYYWNNNFGGFAGEDRDSLYAGCEVTGDHEVVVSLTRYTSKFPDILAHNAYSIHSPAAMEEYDANNVTAQGEGFTWPAYALEHPTGTGAFQFAGYDQANGEVTLERFDDYWGDPAGVSTFVIRSIPDESTRRQELEAGTIHGYDLPNPVDWEALEDSGAQVAIRPAFNILYVGLNPTTNDALIDVRVRQALSYAINRQQLVTSQLPEGAEAASQFFPDTLPGYNQDLEPYPYDPERAEELLAEAGHEDLTIEFWLPTEVTRPYMPDPARIHEAIRTDWEAVGITVETVTQPWTQYIPDTETGLAASYLLGWTGDYASPDNFIGTFFTEQNNAFSTEYYDFADELTDALVTADSEPDPDEREQLYIELNQRIAEDYLPALPISHSPPAIVVAEGVSGLIPSPLSAEDFSTVTLS